MTIIDNRRTLEFPSETRLPPSITKESSETIESPTLNNPLIINGTFSGGIVENSQIVNPSVSEVVFSSVFLTNPNGHGSTNNKIRRYSTVVKNVGSDITFA